MNDKIRFLTHLKYKVRVMWECMYKKLLASNKDLSEFAVTRMPKFSQKYPCKVSAQQILDVVRTGQFQGFVECDIEMPSELPPYLDTNLCSEQYFDDYPPLFARTSVRFDQMSPVMQEYIFKQGLNTAPRKALLSGVQAKKVLLCSSLLKGYLDHSMQVTRIYQHVKINALNNL